MCDTDTYNRRKSKILTRSIVYKKKHTMCDRVLCGRQRWRQSI